jgi:MFS family permease
MPVQKGLGVSHADITLTYSVYMLAYGICGPAAGQLIDRLGARAAYSFGLLSLGLAYLLAGLSTHLWHYMVTVGLLGGLGAASLGMIIASALLSRWFTSRIGSIISLPYAAIGVGMLTVAPLTQLLLHAYDWRITHKILGASVLLLLPLVMLLPLARMTAGSPEWRRAWDCGPSRRPDLDDRPGAAHQCILGPVRRLFRHLSGGPQRAATFGGLSGRARLRPPGGGWRVRARGRPVRHWHPRSRLAVRPLWPRQTATISYLSTMTGITALALVSVFPTMVLVYAFVCFFGLMQGARGLL